MLRKTYLGWRAAIVVGIALLLPLTPIARWIQSDASAQTADIRNTRHNLGSNAPAAITFKTTATGEVCVFCHTPHGSISSAAGPLWNRTLSPATTYTPYSSLTLDGTAAAMPGGSSRLCLSCHDGTLAVGSGLSNTPGSGTAGTGASMTMTGGSACSAPGNTLDTNCIPAGTDGQTRRLGTDLSNDHPIALAFTSTVATADGELRTPPYSVSGSPIVALRQTGTKPKLPLMGTSTTDQAVECNTCHDPHLKQADENIAGVNRDPGKFLRLPRFQTQVITSTHVPAADQVCISCHDKAGWIDSAHVNNVVANEVYVDGGADPREFPRSTSTNPTTVRRAGCLNCHDTHTNTGARRLLRNGVSGTSSAIENTCFQCHNTSASSALGAASGNTGLRTQTGTGTVQVPDIWTEFQKVRRMPLVVTSEVHEIRNSDFEECRQTLGAINAAVQPGAGSGLGTKCDSLPTGTNTNRHVECTDCHNPHRVRRAALFSDQSSETDGNTGRYRTHIPANGTGGASGNVISGALRGAWGVQPVWSATIGDWPENPNAVDPYLVKRGDPGASTTVGSFSRTNGDAATTYMTREYQLCFKCHSTYGTATFPSLGTTGLTPSGTNGMTTYTNVAAEFAVNASTTITTGTDQGEYNECTNTNCTEDATAIQPAGSSPADTLPTTMTDIAGTQNHRSWHPVMFPTGRTFDERRITSASTPNFRVPFRANVGTQTMHCSDCHGSGGTWTQNSGPNLTTVQGPHGSTNNFLLKGVWDTTVVVGGTTGLCFNCHDPTAGSAGTGDTPGSTTERTSGFNDAGTNGSGGHANAHSSKECMRCHVAVPHGWKNKAFLVNLNCVGPEAGQPSGCTSAGTNPYNVPPYYNAARLRVRIWQPSGSWTEASCGTNAQNSSAWMNANCG